MQLRPTRGSIACPTHNQCKIHEIFASRIQDPTRVQVCSTQDSLVTSKSIKKMLQSNEINTSTEYKIENYNRST